MRTERSGILVTVFGIVSALSWNAHAEGFLNPPDGAANIGRGCARSAFGDDPSIIAHNPAGMMDLGKRSAVVGGTMSYRSSEFRLDLGGTVKTESPWGLLPSAYAVFPLEGNAYAVGVGVHSPYGQAVRWQRDGAFRYLAPRLAQLRTAGVSPAAAATFGAFDVGVALNVVWASLKLQEGVPWAPPPAGLAGPGSVLTLEGDGIGVGATLGATWKMSGRHRLALAYRMPVSVTCSGDMSMNPAFPAGALPPGATAVSDFETNLRFPSVATLGYGCRVTDSIRVQADVEWAEHARNRALDIDVANNNAFLALLLGGTRVPQNWEDTWKYSAGADWSVSPDWIVRFGWSYLPSPVPDATLSPVLAEGDLHLVGIGFGWSPGAGRRLDVAYAAGFNAARTAGGNVNPLLNGRYETASHLMAASYSFGF